MLYVAAVRIKKFLITYLNDRPTIIALHCSVLINSDKNKISNYCYSINIEFRTVVD